MTMDYKTHEEVGEDGSVRGTYTVREPNGDLRVVSYTAGDSRGFQVCLLKLYLALIFFFKVNEC